MKIAIGADHGGFELKQELVVLLENMGHEVHDVGCSSAESVDYPRFATEVCELVSNDDCAAGILVCGTGIGMSMAANRNKKIRAALCYNEYTARMSREHNDANVLCVGARVLGKGVVEDMVKVWIETAFTGGRHQQRIQQFSE